MANTVIKSEYFKLADDSLVKFIPPQAEETVYGGIKAAPKTESDKLEVKIDPATGKLYVDCGNVVRVITEDDYLSNKAAYDASDDLFVVINDKGTVVALSDDESYYITAAVVSYINTTSKLSATNMQAAIDEIATKMIITASNVSVLSSAWVSDETYSDYPYKADITVTNCTANHIPNVNFDMNEAISGIFSPIAASGTDIVTIYARQIPGDIVIPSITCMKGYA